jgi:hypothetical protein
MNLQRGACRRKDGGEEEDKKINRRQLNFSTLYEMTKIRLKFAYHRANEIGSSLSIN